MLSWLTLANPTYANTALVDMSVLCRTLLAREREILNNVRHKTLYPTPTGQNHVITLRALLRNSACGGVKNKDVFFAGPRDGFTPAPQAEFRSNALSTTLT